MAQATQPSSSQQTTLRQQCFDIYPLASGAALRILLITAEWRKSGTAQFDKALELNERVITYIHFQTLRNDLEELLESTRKAIDLVQSAKIGNRTPEEEQAFKDLDLLNVSIIQFKESITKTQLEYNKLCEILSNQMKPNLKLLKRASEPLASSLSSSWGIGVPDAFNQVCLRSPYFDAAVIDYKKKTPNWQEELRERFAMEDVNCLREEFEATPSNKSPKTEESKETSSTAPKPHGKRKDKEGNVKQ